MEIVLILILILLNGFFSLSEIALVSSKLSRLEQYEKEGKRGATKAIQLASDSENFLSAVQVGITLIGIVLGAVGGLTLSQGVGQLLEGITIIAPYAYQIGMVLSVVVITYFSIVLGELVPKSIALSQPEKVAVIVAPIIKLFSKIFYPFVWLLSISTTFVTKLLGIEKHTDLMTESELRQIIRTATKDGVIQQEQNEIHEKVFNFSDKKAKHLMTHRTEVQWIDLNQPFEEITQDLIEYQHSKVICCEESLDYFKGILIVRDFYQALASGKAFKIEDLMITPLVVHENTPATKILEELKQNKNHFCVVVDEYGEFEGIITLLDIMENLVGYIVDEDDEIDEPDVVRREDGSALVSGEAPIEVLEDIIENLTVDFEQIDYSTVAGFMINIFDMIPQVGDTIESLGCRFEIVDMDGNRIDKVLISTIEKTTKKEGGNENS